MVHILIGAAAMAALLIVAQYARRNRMDIQWWQWILTILGLAYVIFVLEVIVSFLEEGAPKGALVMGTMLGFLAVVWIFLVGRFFFTRKKS